MTLKLSYLNAMLMLAGILSPAFPSAEAKEPLFLHNEILLAQNYQPGIDLTAYLISEKLDGVRALWDGRYLRFRSGRIIHSPAWFTSDFPSHPLDGELWMGRRSFDRVSAAVRRLEPIDTDWENITYQIFELPGGSASFEHRLTTLKSSTEKIGLPWLQIVRQFPVTTDQELQKALQDCVDLGGEGLMLHRRDALWQSGRSDVLLKLKAYLDAEATVIGYEPGKGKYQGMMGALLLEMPDGKKFRLGTGFSEADRRSPPGLGSSITYRYRDLTPQGIPRFASFLRHYQEH